MPQVLTTNAVITCPHGFLGVSQSLDPTWSINGGDVLVEGDQGSLPTCNVPAPCGGYTLRSMGLNATLIKGKKVVLVTDFNLTHSGLPLTMSELHHVVDDTTPAPIPDGQTAPPLPPPMADTTSPIVSVVTAVPFVFTKSSNSPPELEATFTLKSPHPLKWVLTMLHEQNPPADQSEDLTNSQPAGLSLSVSNGDWNVSPLDITLKMTAAYMQSLSNLLHRFFMTGVNQRGLSSHVELILTVNP